MTFSRECEYALQGMVTLAAEAGKRPLMHSEIAARGKHTLSFLSKIFQKLRSHRGAERGYTLARPAFEITVREALEAVEGPDLLDRCVFSHRRCSQERSCQVHDIFQEVRPQVQAAFERATLRDLVLGAAACSAVPAPRRRRTRHP
jgi:Rrf2 family protein